MHIATLQNTRREGNFPLGNRGETSRSVWERQPRASSGRRSRPGEQAGDRCLPSELLSSRSKRLQQVAWQPWERRGALASWENSHNAGNSGSSCSDASTPPRPPLVWLLEEQSPEGAGQPEHQVLARRLTHRCPGWDRVPAWAFSPSKSSRLSSF